MPISLMRYRSKDFIESVLTDVIACGANEGLMSV